MITSHSIEITIAIVSLGSLASIYICILFLTFTLDWRLKIEFQKHTNIIPQDTWFFRVICISLNVALKNRSKTDRIMRYHYQGYDFRSFANFYETFFSILLMYSFFTLLLCTLSSYLLGYFGFVDLGLT